MRKINSIGRLKMIIPKKCLIVLDGWYFILCFYTDDF